MGNKPKRLEVNPDDVLNWGMPNPVQSNYYYTFFATLIIYLNRCLGKHLEIQSTARTIKQNKNTMRCFTFRCLWFSSGKEIP